MSSPFVQLVMNNLQLAALDAQGGVWLYRPAHEGTFALEGVWYRLPDVRQPEEPVEAPAPLPVTAPVRAVEPPRGQSSSGGHAP
jgi:hypothetical protein